jgi:hypothetical protein
VYIRERGVGGREGCGTITDAPVYTRERGAGGRGGFGLRRVITVIITDVSVCICE